MNHDAGPIRLGVIGVTRLGAAMLERLSRLEQFELLRCFDTNVQAMSRAEDAYGLEACDVVEDLINDQRLDAVAIFSPDHLHADHIIAAAQAGKHVYVAQPIATYIPAAKLAISTCQDAGVVLQVGHHNRKTALCRKLKQMLEAGEFGKIVLLEVNYSLAGGFDITPESWRYNKQKCPGGVLQLLGARAFDTLEYLAGPIRTISAFSGRLAVPAEIDDVASVAMEFAGGAMGHLGCSYTSPASWRLSLFGTKLNAHCYNEKMLLRTRTHDPLQGTREIESLHEVPQNDSYLQDMVEFAHCIRTGTSPEVDGQVAIRALACVWAAVTSAHKHQPVCPDERLDLEKGSKTPLAE